MRTNQIALTNSVRKAHIRMWIQNTEMLKQKVDYIHNNPVKRGYVDLPEHWRYSSARSYLNEEGLIEVCKDW